ncbi:phenylacetate-CoA oxygenase subunit PaaJ [Pseudomaricurvus alkylphenolicus]|jgi:ring-1,2-phenylacetyl-CoA epoxidase subunit PaaD|uniref:1,2-phenylacetyl-CoA epoxidase subunit PaaD n=1 Tax=Pseudomaricurvus alkylphenolicus TaxID=1306991 RepID=UPI001421CF96|nr:1,2-phenylacetyl-CoA epoxidase subunit PaaD [Pseudomaricurvus alkylphenolicus]NIB40906.1 phenylacetate-CoA oxygenase subunit PaaJ [Pseudomaricurvus alkylphenolicus]
MERIPTLSEEQYQHQLLRINSECEDLWSLLDNVKDPEIPVLSLWDMGILRDVQRQGEKVVVTITPTYSGCPAMDVMREDIELALQAEGIDQFQVVTKLAPAWTTDWMTEKGREQLRGYGIAPPDDAPDSANRETPADGVLCPHCKSDHTRRVSEFGSTACKALFQCDDCGEPFDYFKHI